MSENDPLKSLSEGIGQMPRRKSSRERLADVIYLHLQIVSSLLFILLGGVGYFIAHFWGVLGGAVVGAGIGFWMRRSMGHRGRNPWLGFFIRKCERANGSRPGLLEWLLEAIRGNKFTRAKCRAICDAYQEAERRLARAQTDFQRLEILNDLDRRVKELSYD